MLLGLLYLALLHSCHVVKIWLSPACVVELLASKVHADYLFLYIWQRSEYTALCICMQALKCHTRIQTQYRLHSSAQCCEVTALLATHRRRCSAHIFLKPTCGRMLPQALCLHNMLHCTCLCNQPPPPSPLPLPPTLPGHSPSPHVHTFCPFPLPISLLILPRFSQSPPPHPDLYQPHVNLHVNRMCLSCAAGVWLEDLPVFIRQLLQQSQPAAAVTDV